MNKELQDKAWSVLPKEFKEEMKEEYHRILNGSWRVSSYLRGRLRILREIFGLHNLTSGSENLSEPKPSEPRFKVNDHVRVISADKYGEDGYIVKVEEDDDRFFYTIEGIEDWRFFEPNLEPYTEPEEESRNLSQETANCDKHFDNILKDSFRNERRLNIAAMAMQGILSNHQLLKIALETYQEEIGSPDIYVAVAKAAKEQADALIAECELTETDTEIIV